MVEIWDFVVEVIFFSIFCSFFLSKIILQMRFFERLRLRELKNRQQVKFKNFSDSTEIFVVVVVVVINSLQ